MVFTANGVDLPAPISIKVDDEIIWSSNTGRTASGLMTGDVIAKKKTISISWGVMNDTDMKKIKNNLIDGFFPFKFHDAGVDLTINSYRGTISNEHIGELGDGHYWYKSASVKIVQQ